MKAHGQSARALVAMALACGPANTASGKPPDEGTLRAIDSVYDLGRSEASLDAARGGDIERSHKMSRALWQLRDGHVVLDLPFVRSLSNVKGCMARCWGVKFRIPLRNAGALGARRTRVTLTWTTVKDSWSEEQALLWAGGMWRLDALRPSSGPTANRQISVEVPAAAVRQRGYLQVALLIAEHAEPAKPRRAVIADALELELLP